MAPGKRWLISSSKPTAVHVGIGLGSNVGDRLGNLRRARDMILALPGVFTGRSAPLYESEPVDCAPGTEPFLNTVMEIACSLAPAELLAGLHGIEIALGRPALHLRNAPRSIDLDLLYADDLRLDAPGLTLPHPRLAQRRFVLAPLADLRPGWTLPGAGAGVADLLRALPPTAGIVARVASAW